MSTPNGYNTAYHVVDAQGNNYGCISWGTYSNNVCTVASACSSVTPSSYFHDSQGNCYASCYSA